MSQQQAEQFIETIQEDESMMNDLQESFDVDHHNEIESQEHVEELFKKIVAFASERGYEFSSEEYAEAAKETNLVQDGELTEEQLEHVAGGGLLRAVSKFVGNALEDKIKTEIYDCDEHNIFD